MKRIVLIVFTIIIVCGICYFFLKIRGTNSTVVSVQMTQVKNGPFTASILGHGKILARKKEQILSLVDGVIVDRGKSIGQYIPKGTVIATLRLRDFDLRKKKQELENALIDFELLEEQVKQSDDLLNAKAISGKEIKELRIRKYKQEKYIKDLREEISEKPIRSSFGGLLAEKLFIDGDHIRAGIQLATIVDTSSIAVEIRAEQHNIPYIHTGQKVQFISPLFPGVRTGKVLEIAKSAFNNQLNQVEPAGIEPEFSVLASIETLKTDNLLLGAQIDARFIIQEKMTAFYIPVEALLYRNDSTIVYIADKGLARRCNVKIGLANDNYLEIIDGLTVADTVITFGNLEVFEGCPIIDSRKKNLNDQTKSKNKFNLLAY